MKKKVFLVALIFGFGLLSSVNAQNIEEMKVQKEVLSLHTSMMEKKIDLEKEKLNNTKLKDAAEGLNRKSDRQTNDYKPSDANSTMTDAKKTAKTLKKTESANKDLDRSNNRIISYEADIRKIQTKLDRLKYDIEIKEK